jgi:hypothetical protein
MTTAIRAGLATLLCAPRGAAARGGAGAVTCHALRIGCLHATSVKLGGVCGDVAALQSSGEIVCLHQDQHWGKLQEDVVWYQQCSAD